MAGFVLDRHSGLMSFLFPQLSVLSSRVEPAHVERISIEEFMLGMLLLSIVCASGYLSVFVCLPRVLTFCGGFYCHLAVKT